MTLSCDMAICRYTYPHCHTESSTPAKIPEPKALLHATRVNGRYLYTSVVASEVKSMANERESSLLISFESPIAEIIS